MPNKAPDGAFFVAWRAVLWIFGQKSGRPIVAVNEEATHHVRPADPTDPGDAADLSNSMGFLKVPLKNPAPKLQCQIFRWLIQPQRGGEIQQ